MLTMILFTHLKYKTLKLNLQVPCHHHPNWHLLFFSPLEPVQRGHNMKQIKLTETCFSKMYIVFSPFFIVMLVPQKVFIGVLPQGASYPGKLRFLKCLTPHVKQ